MQTIKTLLEGPLRNIPTSRPTRMVRPRVPEICNPQNYVQDDVLPQEILAMIDA